VLFRTASPKRWRDNDPVTDSSLETFIRTHRNEIIARCEVKVAARPVSTAAAAAIDHGVPLFLDHLLGELRSSQSETAALAKGASAHGRDLLRQGFTVSQVVYDYGDVCQSITDLAVETNAPIEAEGFRTLNRCLDDAVAAAVTAHASEQASNRNQASQAALQMLLDTAISSFEMLRTGRVGVSGSTGALLAGSLYAMNEYLRSLKTDPT
jgi:hypothetical protein